MSRAADIVAAYVEGKSFAHPHSAEELLVMAHDDMAKRMREAQAYADEIKRRYESAVAQRAMECISPFKEVELVPPSTIRPGQWTAVLRPAMYEFHHMSTHPSQWDVRFKEDVCERAGKHLARLIFSSFEK
jgi:hypothetical protein